MLRIRLARAGAKKRPYYHIVVAEARAPRDGKYLERLGFFNPLVNQGDPLRVKVNEDRVKHWISNGAKPSDRVHRCLSAIGIIPEQKINKQTKQQLPKAKAIERAKKHKLASEKLEASRASASKASEIEKASNDSTSITKPVDNIDAQSTEAKDNKKDNKTEKS